MRWSSLSLIVILISSAGLWGMVPRSRNIDWCSKPPGDGGELRDRFARWFADRLRRR